MLLPPKQDPRTNPKMKNMDMDKIQTRITQDPHFGSSGPNGASGPICFQSLISKIP